MSTLTTDPAAPPPIDAHVPPPRGAGLRKNAVYLAGLVGAAVVLGGLAIAPERQRAILESLGFTVGDDWQVTPPTWRRDIDGPADLVEDVIRIEGLDKVPSVPLPRDAGGDEPKPRRAGNPA